MHNTEMKIDRRQRKTRKAIKNALVTLMSQGDISQITITDIADTADINRKTFYAHYMSVYAILDDIENDLIISLSGITDANDFDKHHYNLYDLLERFTLLINENCDFYSKLLTSTASGNLLAKVKEVLKIRLLEEISSRQNTERIRLEMGFEFVAGGAIAVYQQWFNSDRTQSLEEISQLISIIAYEGLNSLIYNKQGEQNEHN